MFAVRCSQVERFVRCSVNVERFVRMFAFVFGERFVVFAGLIFLTLVRCSVNVVRMRPWQIDVFESGDLSRIYGCQSCLFGSF